MLPAMHVDDDDLLHHGLCCIGTSPNMGVNFHLVHFTLCMLVWRIQALPLSVRGAYIFDLI